MLRKSFEPVVDYSDVEGGGVADSEFVVAGSEGSLVFELVDATFDRVAVLVGGWVERWRATAPAATASAVAGLVGRGRDGGFDPMIT